MTAPDKELFQFDSFRLDPAEHLLLRDGEPVPLEPKVFETLLVLIRHGGRLVGKDELMKEVWPDSFVEESNLTRNISVLRKALTRTDNGPQYIETVPKRGYRFAGDVCALAGERAELIVQSAKVNVIVEEEESDWETRGQGDRATRREGEVTTAQEHGAATLWKQQSFRKITGHKLKAAMVVAVVIAAAAVSYYYFSAPNTNAAINSIAVLPFVNESGNPDVEYLSDGMTESLINSLTQLPNLKVIARSSVFRYKGKETDPFAVGKELGVGAVLSGRIIQRGDTLAISTELIDVRDNKQLWGEQYEQKTSDLLVLQRNIATEIVGNLRMKISGEDHDRITKHYTDNTEAYQLYLKGRFYLNKQTKEGGRKALDYFNQAIEKDPNYGLAYAGLADSYEPLPNESPNAAVLKARAAITRALAIDDKLCEAHVAFAAIKKREWDWPGSEKEFRRAIELNANYAPAHDWYAWFLAEMGRFDEAFREIKPAQELDPLSLVISRHFGTMFLFAHQDDQGLEQLKKNLDMDPAYVMTYVDLGWAYDKKGMYQEAIAYFQKAADLDPENSFAIAGLGHAYALWGKKDKAQAMLHRLTELSKHSFVTPNHIAIIYAGLENKDLAFAWLEKTYEEHDDFSNLKVAPMFENLYSDPRFADLLRRVGFTP